MLGSTHPQSSKTKPLARQREASLHLKVDLPQGDDEASRRLVRKIRSSIQRTLEMANGGAYRVSVVGTPEGSEPAVPKTPARATPPGCGAWWNF